MRALTFSAILTDQGLVLEPGFVVEGKPSEPDGDLVVQALGRAGDVVAATRLAADEACTPGSVPGAGPMARIAVGLVPFPREATGLRVSLDAQLLLERTAPRGRLEAKAEWPRALTREHVVRWRAPADECRAVLGYSNDDGKHWEPLSLPTASDSITFDTRYLPGGAPGLLELRVTDGLRTIALRSEPYEIKPKGWLLWILAPVDGATLPAGHMVRLAAQAYHVEERQPSLEGIRWSSSVDGDLGDGAVVERVLSAGEHRVTAQANDRKAQIAVTVTD